MLAAGAPIEGDKACVCFKGKARPPLGVKLSLAFVDRFREALNCGEEPASGLVSLLGGVLNGDILWSPLASLGFDRERLYFEGLLAVELPGLSRFALTKGSPFPKSEILGFLPFEASRRNRGFEARFGVGLFAVTEGLEEEGVETDIPERT